MDIAERRDAWDQNRKTAIECVLKEKKRILYFAIQDPIISERKSTAAIVAENADDAQKKKKTGINRKY